MVFLKLIRAILPALLLIFMSCGKPSTTGGNTDELSEAQRAEIKKLEQLGYLGHGGTFDDEAIGVTYWQPELTDDGLNFYLPGHEPMGVLMNMEGEELYTWHYGILDAFPDFPLEPEQREPNRKFQSWRRAHLFPNGDVMIIFEGVGLVKIDRHSNQIWARRNHAHHDLDVMEDGTIFVLTREAGLFPEINPEEPILHDSISKLDSEGHEIESISVYEAIARSEFSDTLDVGPTQGDITHTNTLQVLTGDYEVTPPFLKKGNILISIREKHLLAVIDFEEGKAVWAMTGPWKAQHEPTVTRSGRMVVFDNMGRVGKFGEMIENSSRILEFDPVSGEITWRFEGSEASPFASNVLGTVSELPNGNYLVAESRGGRALEISKKHGVVWEFRVPYRFGNDGELSASINEMIRLPEDFPQWLDKAGVPQPASEATSGTLERSSVGAERP